MVTPFGKKLRVIRIERDIFLKDMAEQLDVSIAYLSAVENGKRNIPDDWVEKLGNLYGVYKDELKKLIFESRKKATIDFTRNEKVNDVIIAFARKVEDLDEGDIKLIQEILNK